MHRWQTTKWRIADVTEHGGEVTDFWPYLNPNARHFQQPRVLTHPERFVAALHKIRQNGFGLPRQGQGFERVKYRTGQKNFGCRIRCTGEIADFPQ